MYLACAKPVVEVDVMNIDCALNDSNAQRIKPSEVADKVVYGTAVPEKDEAVSITNVEGSPDKPYDVQYQVRSMDYDKVKKIIESSTFFAKAYGKDQKEVKDAVKPFYGLDLDLPTKEELESQIRSELPEWMTKT